MANDSFNLKIITPIGLVSEEQVTAAKLPASEGEIGVMPEHVPYIGNLGIGVLEYDSVLEKKTKRLVICEGFCSFEADSLVVLTDKVIFAESVNKAEFASERETLKLVVAGDTAASSEWILANNKLKEIEAIEALLA
jgi:F-type H+-transporting ATPase subunit epsilon